MDKEDIIQEMKRYNFKIIEVLDRYASADGPFIRYEYGRGKRKVYGLSHISVIEKIISIKKLEAEEEAALIEVKRLKNSEPGAINKLKEAEQNLKNIRRKIRLMKAKKS